MNDRSKRIRAFSKLETDGMIDAAYKVGVFQADSNHTPSCLCDLSQFHDHAPKCKLDLIIIGHDVYTDLE